MKLFKKHVATRDHWVYRTALFERAATDSGVKLPPSVRPYLARLLWMYQMGLILFWMYESKDQGQTALLYEKTLKMLLVTLKIAVSRCCGRCIGWRESYWW